jgi:pimeloyl-ACP methyl ester carboxylesterase
MKPKGGIVLVHGSGRTRRFDGLARLFADNGFAVFTYDKRGVGGSGGVYEGTYNVTAENLRLLADDAGVAMQTLRARPEVAGLGIGYWGISQAGWIIPLAAAAQARPDFMVLWSGPVCTVAEEIEAGIGNGGNNANDQLAREFVRTLRSGGGDTDPRDALRRLAIPGLWIYGGRDPTLPVALSIERLQGLIDGGSQHFSYWLDSSAGHDMDLEVSSPFIQAMMRWMADHAQNRG